MQLGAFGNRVDRMAQPQARVPQHADKLGERVFEPGRLRFALDQNQNIDVRIGKQFASAVAAHGQHGKRRRGRRLERSPIRLQRQFIDHTREPG